MATSVTTASRASLTSAAQDAKRANATITPAPATNKQVRTFTPSQTTGIENVPRIRFRVFERASTT